MQENKCQGENFYHRTRIFKTKNQVKILEIKNIQ